MKQYYYKMNDCKALHATDAECICWHDEGTGPFPGIRIGVHACHLRDKPEANKKVSDTQDIERELKAANERIKMLEDWKESALAVEREWDANAVATMIGGKLGESHRKVIQREVPKLLTRIKRLEDAGDAILNANNDDEEYEAMKQWRKAKEAKL